MPTYDQRALFISLLLANCQVPLRIAFDIHNPNNYALTGQGGWLALDIIFDIFFLVDIFINFRTAYTVAGELETRGGKVCANYLKGWFLMDMVASIPTTIITSLAGGDAATTTGSGPYTHTREITGTRPSVPLTMEIVRGNTGKSDVVTGARITSAEWSVAVGELVRVKISVIGKSAARQNTGTIPSLSGARLVVKHHKLTSAVVTWNSGSYALRSFSLKLDRKLARNDKLGSLYTGEPPASDFTDVTCEITRVQADEVWRTAHEAGTQSDLVIGFTDGTRSITWTVQSAMITACSDPISAVGEIMQSATFVGLDDDTDPGLKQVEVNSQATGEAA